MDASVNVNVAAPELAANQDVYRTLLESTKAIPWRVDWKTLRFTYIGPQIETLLGWAASSWLTIDDWAMRIHPEDRERVVNFCVSQSKAGTDHEADYRALTPSGGYVWLRDVVHVVRDATGEVEALVGFMFDISERKRTEERLIELQHELETLSLRDALTGIGNRRHFDAQLETEWASAFRDRQPLSLIFADIDYFKQYNDHYGHLRGDECLRSVADALTRAATRPRDFVARFGGEEFVIVLPNTDLEAAQRIAERCRSMLYEVQIPHAHSSVAPCLTLSLGVGTTVPAQRVVDPEFVARVDERLYHAKRNGRNRAEAMIY